MQMFDTRYWRLVKFVQRWIKESPDQLPPEFIAEYNQDHAPILRILSE